MSSRVQTYSGAHYLPLANPAGAIMKHPLRTSLSVCVWTSRVVCKPTPATPHYPTSQNKQLVRSLRLWPPTSRI